MPQSAVPRVAVLRPRDERAAPAASSMAAEVGCPHVTAGLWGPLQALQAPIARYGLRERPREPSGFASPQEGQVWCLANTLFLWFRQLAFGHCQSPGLLPPKPRPVDFAEPHFGQDSCLAKTNFEWFRQFWLGHCQSPGLPPTCRGA